MITEPAPAKINLALHVRRRRPDGYHDIETLFAFCTHGDVVHLAPATTDTLTVTGPFAAALEPPSPGGGGQGEGSPQSSPAREGRPAKLVERAQADATTADTHTTHPEPPTPQSEAPNLVTRAAQAFTRTFALPACHAITLEKNLPVASGLGGGSADAAATLRALARLHGVALDDPRLAAVAAPLGADVPACLLGRTALGEGRGDDLTPLVGLAGTPVLLVNPNVAVSTAAVYRAWDGRDRGAIPSGALLARARDGRNDLEPPARAAAPAIDAVLALLAAAPGVLLARMSGSGATCFALFEPGSDLTPMVNAARARGWWALATTLV